uniref:Uncharacterized protein n=1 Tax=Ciona intestinalis TaxID=7719 RepID=H2XQQ6_CIOIN
RLHVKQYLKSLSAEDVFFITLTVNFVNLRGKLSGQYKVWACPCYSSCSTNASSIWHAKCDPLYKIVHSFVSLFFRLNIILEVKYTRTLNISIYVLTGITQEDIF